MSAALIRPEWLQRAVGILGLSFPFVLFAIAGPRESISAYFHSPANVVFVGWLHMVALALAVYVGYDGGDKLLARAAACGLLVLIYIPTSSPRWALHLAGALVFFGAIAALCWRFGYGSRPKLFRGLSLGIVACIAWALVAGLTGGSIFAAEAVAVLLFGAAWLLKSWPLRGASQAGQRSA